jgi:hypothetical protein
MISRRFIKRAAVVGKLDAFNFDQIIDLAAVDCEN